jgi:hypothetical protein
MVFQNNVLSGAGGSGTTVYAIDQSIRFNEADSPYMQKTYSGDGSRTTWSFSFWTKLGKSPPYNTTRGIFLIAYNTTSGAQEDIRIEGSNQQLQWFTHNDGGTGTLADLKTTQYLRDHSAWYHILCVADRTNAIASERQRMYINGQRVTDFATETYPSQSAEGHVGKSADVHYIGSRAGNSSTRIDGYMAEIHYLDGLAYDPSFFGEFNDSGIWVPKEYTGSYGTNGFKIDGRDASDLGDDESGNGNDFTTSGLAAHDQVLDSPTNNFCVMNAIENVPCNFSEGNLTLDSTANFSGNAMRGTIHIKGGSTGKWYYEVVGSLTGDYFSTGWMLSSIITPSSTVIGQDTGSVAFYNTGSYQNGSNAQHVITKPAAGDVIGVGLDASTGQVFLRDDSGYFVGTLSSNALSSGVVITGFSGEDLVMASRNSSSGTCTYNFGQDGTFAGAKTAQGNTDANGIGNFFYTVPDGFLAICTKNLGS